MLPTWQLPREMPATEKIVVCTRDATLQAMDKLAGAILAERLAVVVFFARLRHCSLRLLQHSVYM